MKRNYEAIIVLNTAGKEEAPDEMVQQIGKEIEEEGASLEGIEKMGSRKFVYNARKLDSGYYVSFQFQCEPEGIDKLKTRLKLNKDIHLQHYQRV